MNDKKHHIILLFAVVLLCLASLVFGQGEYVLGPKDVLEITVFDEPELSKTIEIGSEGAIRFPLLNDVKLGGLSVREAEKLIEKKLGEKFLRNPHVSILVKEYNSKKVYVLGAVAKPGYYSLQGDTSLLEVISKAGGITQGGGTKILVAKGAGQDKEMLSKILARKTDDKGETIEDFTRETGLKAAPILIDGHKLLEEGDISLNVTLDGGDVVYIPNVQKVYVLGEVKRPGGIIYEDGLTLLRAISLAGGVTEMGKTKVQVTREVDGKEERFKVNLKSIIKDMKKDIPLKANDVIVVPRRIF